MSDKMIRMTAANDTIRAFAVSAGDTVEEMRRRHGTSPVVTAALGRLLCGAAMMSMMEKDEEDLLTLQVSGDGPIGTLTVTASGGGVLKGLASHTDVEVPPKYAGKLDVGRAVGHGVLRVMRDTGAPEPYAGTVELVSGEIAEDLTYYFAQSEQTPSAVGLGVLVDRDCRVAEAGGFIVQLMPDAAEETIAALEKNIGELPQVTALLSEGAAPEDILERVLSGLSPRVLEHRDVSYRCDCSKERVIRSLLAISRADLVEMVSEARADGKPIEARCHFCNETYVFSPEELERAARITV